jgi:tetratricopeptide (TPR) repeat protein
MKNRQIVRLLMLVFIAFLALAPVLLSKNDSAFFFLKKTPLSKIPQKNMSHLEMDRLNNLPDQDGKKSDIRDMALSYRKIGVSAFKEHRYEDALASFEEGLRYDQDDIGLLLSMAATCLTISEYDRAKNTYERILALDPNNVQALKELGELYYLINEPENAEIVWSQAAALDPDDALLEERLSKLRKQLSAVEDFDLDENIHFAITYDGISMPDLSYTVLGIMEDAYYEIGGRLYIYPKRQISVTLMTKETFFDITGFPDWTSGLYEGQIKIPVSGADPDDLKEVLYHEFVHAVLYDQIGTRCPWWLNEGLAQYLSDTDGNQNDEQAIVHENASFVRETGLSEHGDVLKMNRKNAGLAYASALSAVRFLVDSHGEPNLQRIIESMSEGESFESAFWTATGYSFEEFEKDWKRHATGDPSL